MGKLALPWASLTLMALLALTGITWGRGWHPPGNLAWVATVPGTTRGGNIATGGDLVFEAVDKVFYALDAKTGKRLADVPMKISAFSSPLAYMAGGKQFVAVASGSSVVAIGLP